MGSRRQQLGPAKKERSLRRNAGEGAEIDLLVMEYLDGEALEARLNKGPLPLDQALRSAIDIADALAAAHHARGSRIAT